MPATECKGASTTACSSVVNSTVDLSDGVATAFEPGAVEVDGTANMIGGFVIRIGLK